MKLSLAYSYHIALLLSFAYASYSAADNLESLTSLPAVTGTSDDTQVDSNAGSESAETKKQASLSDHFKHALAAGLIKVSETHKIDETSAHIYSPEEDCTFSSAVSNNGDGIIDRLKRGVMRVEPTISISTGAVFTPDETNPNARYKRALLKFAQHTDELANNSNISCTQATDSNGNQTVVCTIVMNLTEFNALKEQYNAHNS